MTQRVNVMKRITFILITMALAVAMVACSGAAGAPGPAGPPGPPGQDAPTPEPTDPATPTEPTVPSGAAPTVTKMFTDIYLTLAGAGKMKYVVDLRDHITDVDSLLRYTVESSDSTVATAVEKNATLTVTAAAAGSATITVTANDDEGASTVPASFSVTVVKTNAAPTTSGLNVSDVTELQKKLYIVEGLRSDTITVMSNAGAAAPVTDEIVDKFRVIVGTDDKGVDDLVTVTVKKGTEDHKYVIGITPKAEALNKASQTIEIYPMDKFGAEVSTPWKFNATFNKSPNVLKDSFGTVELHRGGGAPNAITGAVTALAVPSGESLTFATLIKISEYFRAAHFDNSPEDGSPDSSCTVSAPASTGLAVVQELNALGAGLVANDGSTNVAEPADATTAQTAYRESTTEATGMAVGTLTGIRNGGPDSANPPTFILPDHVRAPSEMLAGILIDGRYSSYGADMIDNVDLADDALTTTEAVANADVRIKGKNLNSFTVTLTCMDKDGGDEVTGKVVVRGNTVTP